MLDAIQNFVERYLTPATGAGAESDARRVQLATAALLFEMTRMDYKVRPEERQEVAALVKTEFGLSDEETRDLVSLAEERVRQSTSYFEFTSLLNREFTAEQKVKVIENLWRVAYADGDLDKYEEHLVRKIADLLYVPHRDFIAAKLRVSRTSPAGG